MLNPNTSDTNSIATGILATEGDASLITLPYYGGLVFPVDQASASRTATLRIQEASVYDYHGRPSLSFVFPFRRETRHTARIRDQRIVTDADGATFRAYLTSMFVRCGVVEGDLDVWLIDAPMTHADATIPRQCLRGLA